MQPTSVKQLVLANPRRHTVVFLVIAEVTKWTALVLGLMIGIEIAIQLLYPSGYTLPLQQLGATKVGLQSQSTIANRLQKINSLPIEFKVGDALVKTPLAATGTEIQPEHSARSLVSYPVKKRLIPFSILNAETTVTLTVKKDPLLQKRFLQNLKNTTVLSAKDAAVVKAASGYSLSPEVIGKTLDETAALHALDAIEPQKTRVVTLSTVDTPPAIRDESVNRAIEQVNNVMKTPPVLRLEARTFQPSAQQILAWSTVTTHPESGTTTVGFDEASVRTWLYASLPSVLKSPTAATKTFVDGEVTNNSPGSPGIGVDFGKTIADYMQTLTAQGTSATVSTRILTATESVARQYTPSAKGLSAMIGDWKAGNAGLRAGVSFRELGGEGRSADLEPGLVMPTASIYKLYVAWYVYDGIEKGSINANEIVGSTGKSISQCLEVMIVVSNNPCGEGLGTRFGWANINNFVHASGYPGTSLSRSPIASTAADTAKLLTDLASGKLLNEANTASLRNMMARQIYRSAIPAGATGSSVQDKVGFLPGVWNDAAIVLGPKVSYVLVVYTNGNPSAIKDLTSKINALFTQ